MFVYIKQGVNCNDYGPANILGYFMAFQITGTDASLLKKVLVQPWVRLAHVFLSLFVCWL